MNPSLITKKQLVLVLGMHRSGTSAITRALSVCGVSLGDHLMPAADENNLKGFWEDIDLNNLNIQMLSALSCDWDFLSPITPSDIQKLNDLGFFIKGMELIQKKLISNQVLGLKDPRMARLMPFWANVFDELDLKVSYVLAIRNPLSVANSLIKRDKLPREKCYLLWLIHVLSCLIHAKLKHTLVIDYDKLMLSPIDQLVRLSHFLSLELDHSQLEIYKSEFLDIELQHHTFSLDELLSDPSCSNLVRDIYKTLCDISIDHINLNNSSFAQTIKDWNFRFQDLYPALNLLDYFENELDSNLSTIHSLNLQTLDQSQIIVERDVHIQNLDFAIQSRDIHISNLDQALLDKDKRISNLDHLINDKDSHISNLDHLIVDKETHISNLNNSISNKQLEIELLTQKSINFENELRNILNSNSWKITQPLRSLSQLFKSFFQQNAK